MHVLEDGQNIKQQSLCVKEKQDSDAFPNFRFIDFKVLKPVAAQPSEVHKHGYKESHV